MGQAHWAQEAGEGNQTPSQARGNAFVPAELWAEDSEEGMSAMEPKSKPLTDTERLDWLTVILGHYEGADIDVPLPDGGMGTLFTWVPDHETLREAIDAFIAEAKNESQGSA
jgi:hypothetical protein